MEIQVQYDKNGRMKYHPEFHKNHRQPWSREDHQYLIEWYYIIGPEEMSFALDRTITTVATKAYELTKLGIMKKPANRCNHRRVWKEAKK